MVKDKDNEKSCKACKYEFYDTMCEHLQCFGKSYKEKDLDTCINLDSLGRGVEDWNSRMYDVKDSYSDEITLPCIAQRIACASRQQAEYLRLKRKYEKHVTDKYSRKLEKLREDYEQAKDAYVRTLSTVVLDIALIFSQNNFSLNDGVRDAYLEHKGNALHSSNYKPESNKTDVQ